MRTGSNEARVDGILNIDKPYGITSMEVVRRIKRASGLKRVGHGGTLDPVATGVVPVCVGQATRLMEYLIEGSKDYRAVIELGVATDTYDALGTVTETRDASQVGLADVQEALKPLKGSIKQVPPMFSALKRQGKRLYDLARAGIEVEREARDVEVLNIGILDWSPPELTVDVSCGRGFYMRSLAHDLGQSLGCGAHLKSLVRLRTGPFRASEAIPLPDAEERFAGGAWQDLLYASDIVLTDLPAAILGRRHEQMVRDGRALPTLRVGEAKPDERCRVYDVDGRFVGILKFDQPTGRWRPDKVIPLG